MHLIMANAKLTVRHRVERDICIRSLQLDAMMISRSLLKWKRFNHRNSSQVSSLSNRSIGAYSQQQKTKPRPRPSSNSRTALTKRRIGPFAVYCNPTSDAKILPKTVNLTRLCQPNQIKASEPTGRASASMLRRARRNIFSSSIAEVMPRDNTM